MISAEQIARSHSSFWRTATPMMEHYVRLANVRTTSVGYSIPTSASPTRRALIAELAFEVFRRFADSGVEFIPGLGGLVPLELRRRIADYISQLPGAKSTDLFSPLTSAETSEVGLIADALLEFFGPRVADRPFQVRPRFPGCGVVDSAVGDVIAGQTLYEVKTVERALRAVEFRQLLVYVALHHADSGRLIPRGGILNPRLGEYYGFEFDQMSRQVAGVSLVELVGTVIEHISGAEISM